MPKQSASQLAWYKRNKQAQIAASKVKRRALYKAHRERKHALGCGKCVENNPACLDWHHTDPSTKLFSIATGMTRGYGAAKMEEEIAKCVLLCANCHRKEHAAEVLSEAL